MKNIGIKISLYLNYFFSILYGLSLLSPYLIEKLDALIDPDLLFKN